MQNIDSSNTNSFVIHPKTDLFFWNIQGVLDKQIDMGEKEQLLHEFLEKTKNRRNFLSKCSIIQICSEQDYNNILGKENIHNIDLSEFKARIEKNDGSDTIEKIIKQLIDLNEIEIEKIWYYKINKTENDLMVFFEAKLNSSKLASKIKDQKNGPKNLELLDDIVNFELCLKTVKPNHKPAKKLLNPIKKSKKIIINKENDIDVNNEQETNFAVFLNLKHLIDSWHETLEPRIQELVSFETKYEIVMAPKKDKKKGWFEEDESEPISRILKKNKTVSLMDYSIDDKNKALENMLNLKIENAVLNEVSICDEETIIEKKEKIDKNNDKYIIYEYKWGGGSTGEKQTVVQITKGDIDRLAPESLLNDNIIWFYLKFMQNEILDDYKRSKCYIFNTYFYQKFYLSLNNMLINQVNAKDYEKGFNSIKKWTKNIDIFDKEFIILPIHDDIQKHWCLFIIVYPNLLYKKLMNTNQGIKETQIDGNYTPMILYFDSLNILDKGLAIPIRRYLELEFIDKKPDDYKKIEQNWTGITDEILPCYQPLVLLQDNLKDCGIFVLEYTESFLNDPEFIINNIKENHNKLKWFPKKLIKSKRSHIKNIVSDLSKGDDIKGTVKKYLKEREDIIKNYCEDKDFDHIDMSEFRNFLSTINYEINQISILEKQEQMQKFYITKAQEFIKSSD